MSREDRLAVCAELVELVAGRSQPELAAFVGVRQNTISKALRRGEVGPGVADDLVAKLGTTREALRKKHADVISGKREPPWETWLKMNRKPGNRTDLLTVATQLDVAPTPPPSVSPDELEGARAIMEGWKWPKAAIASAERHCQVTDPSMDARAIATMWDSWLLHPPSRERSTGPAESLPHGPRSSGRPAGR